MPPSAYRVIAGALNFGGKKKDTHVTWRDTQEKMKKFKKDDTCYETTNGALYKEN